MDENRVVLDTDFISGITGYRDGDAADLFRRIFTTLEKVPVVHSFLAKYELDRDPIAQTLLQEGFIQSISCDKLSVPAQMDGKAAYRDSFSDMYMRVKGDALPEKTNIFMRKAKSSFGEIHSILLATELGIPLFYSNDSDAKVAAKAFSKGRLTIMNAIDVASQLESSTSIDAKERKFLRNYYRRKKYDPKERPTL